MTATLIALGALVAFNVFAARRLLRYLHIFQQEEYDAGRFFTWLMSSLAVDKKLTAAIVLILLAALTIEVGPIYVTAMLALAMLAAAFMEPDPLKDAKKKLALTQRATRILGVAFLLTFITGCLALAFGGAWLWIAAVHLVPVLLVAANWLLSPVEKRIQDGFRIKAENRLSEINPTVIGITGSFGKTSVKHILGHVLQLTTNALYTPGSVNTVMGISRIINERLDQNCRFFVVEMGAYGKGSIERLCKFTPPHHGILTSIGAAHYERFKDLETVAQAKFELATAVQEKRGRMVIHESVLERAYAKERVTTARDDFIVVGDTDKADIRITGTEQTADGLTVELEESGSAVTLFAPLYGHHHAGNMALAYALARHVGIDRDKIVAAMRTTPQIRHRLEVRTDSTGITYLDDAYNSNPSGFANALDLMQVLRKAESRRILVTPGMAELGEKHDEAHREIGKLAANAADFILLVKPERIPTFADGFHAAGGKAQLLTFERFAEARSWLDDNAVPGDIVLIENDLPDLYERTFPT